MSNRNTDIAARIFGFIVLLLMTAAVAVQSPGVQRHLAGTFLNRISEKLESNISFSSVNIQAPGTVGFTDILILDKNPYTEDKYDSGYAPVDTILYVKEVQATISARTLLSGKGIHLRRVDLKGASGALVHEPDREYRNNITRLLAIHPKGGDSTFNAPLITIGRIHAEDVRFRLVNFRKPHREYPPGCINYADLDAHAKYLDARNFRVDGAYISGAVDKADITEKSGCSVVASGKVKAGILTTEIRDIHINDGASQLDIPLFFMGADYPKAFRDFSEHVRLKLKVAKSVLDSKTVSSFGRGILYGNSFLLDISQTEAEGYVNDFSVGKLKFKDLYGDVEADLKASATGLTISPNLLLDATINKLDFTTAGLDKMLANMLPAHTVNISKYADGGRLAFNGSVSGSIDRLKAKGRLRSGKGSVNADLSIRNLSSKTGTKDISGRVASNNFNVGRLIRKDFIGKVSANAGFRASLASEGINVRVDSLMVDKLGLLGYDYTGIAAAGVYSENAFDGKIICADPNLNFIFQGLFNLSPKTRNAVYKFSANVGYADLEALHLDNRGGTSKVSGRVNTNFMKIPHGDILGDISLLDITLENDNGVKYIGDIEAGSHFNGETTRAQITSSFMDAGYVGNRSMLDLWNDLQTMTTRRELPALYKKGDKDQGSSSGKYDVSIDFHDSRDLLSFVKPGLYIADSTSMELRSDGRGRLRGSVRSPRLAYLANYLKGLDIEFDNYGGSANAILLTDELRIKKIGLVNSAFTAYAQKNEFFMSFHYDNIEGIDNMGELYLSGQIARDAGDTLTINAKPLSSYVRFEDSQWDLAESDITYRAGEVNFNDFFLYNGNQTLSINGGISRNRPDTLIIGINDIDLGIVNHFTAKDLGLNGKTSGRAMLSSGYGNNLRFLLNMACDSLMVEKTDAGTLRMAAAWDSESGRVSAFVRDVMDGFDALNLRAGYYPAEKVLDMDARFEGFNLAMLSPVLPDGIRGLGGKLNGGFRAQGSLDTLSVSSDGARIEDGVVTVGYTGVSYKFGGPFNLDKNGLTLDNFDISDNEGGHALVNGGILFAELPDFRINTSLRLSNLKLMDNNANAGPLYGNLYASGNISATGPADGLFIDADIYTGKAGDIHLALNGASSSEMGDLLTFTDHNSKEEDPYEQMLGEFLLRESVVRKAAKMGLVARARVNTTPDLEAVLELDDTGGNFLTARGSGLFSINAEPSRNIFDIGGDYNISSGKYHFAIPGIVNKSFNINSGSSIKFGGDLLDSELDINATYSLRTSINRLLADTSSVVTRRMVNCGISISDKLSSPKLGFSIDIPDLDPTTKSEVESALNTEDKVQKQFLSLVIAGSFLQNEESGIVNNTNVVFSNVSEVISSQLSNILNRMDIPVDFGVGYQQNSSGTNLYDVSLSTELFDSRVELHGSVGNRQYSTTTNPNGDVVGDIDIDVKLDRPGQLRLNMFSHSADEYTSYLDYSQRNGMGITYQNEFNKWSDFFKNMFRSRKKRRQQEASVAREEEKRTITIEEDE